MAGSHTEGVPSSSYSDPILAARLDAIRQLADGLSDRVAVMDRDFTIVYANEAACEVHRPAAEGRGGAKCYQAFAAQEQPCGTCPALTLFTLPKAHTPDCANQLERAACGMRQAFPLVGADGRVAAMLVLLTRLSSGLTPPAPLAEQTGPVARPEGLGELIGRSPVMRELFEMLRLVADSHATVLIHGESGTGKELAAKTIHQLSSRRDRPFIVVDCGSLPETLLESELFGHVKGAFTGATAHKRGLFEEADGGTIFLDEIADTTATFQAKLLRALQEGEIKRVGGNQTISIDVRVVSATNKDLCEMVKTKAFRQDLYYRLAVLPIRLPALRERREDIPLLIEHFVTVSCRRHHQPVRLVPEPVLQALSGAEWPGNVRELQHYIERAIVTTSGPLSCPEHVRAPADDEPDGDLRSVGRSAAIHAERARIIEALKQTGGNRVRAAKLLKISRASLYLKLRDYRIADAEAVR